MLKDTSMATAEPSSILFIPHGGGPLPLMGHDGHRELVSFLKLIPEKLGRPKAILVISAHWERDVSTVTSGPSPELIYDYSGFPSAAYQIDYPVPGYPELAHTVNQLLDQAGIKSKLNNTRGFDHGLFVPLKLMYPKADIPCVQLSLTADLDTSAHLAVGNALAPLCRQNILVLGSGFSFHNMAAFNHRDTGHKDQKNEEFQDWLMDACTSYSHGPDQIKDRLIHWERAPHARYCHPREEHLLPLHICMAMAGFRPGIPVFQGSVLRKKTLALLWQGKQ